MHCLVCSVFVLVFAPNLALHGPVGSMKTAVEGMAAEQDQIFRSFAASLVFFIVTAMATFWYAQDHQSHNILLSNLFSLILSSYWYLTKLSFPQGNGRRKLCGWFMFFLRFFGGCFFLSLLLANLQQIQIPALQKIF